MTLKKCDIIIPVWNELESTKECIDRLKRHTYHPYRLIVIDNGSLTPAMEYLESLKGAFPGYVLIRNDKNLGFVKAVNQGMAESTNDYLCILNNDAYVTDNWLTSLIDTVETGPRNIGIANPASNIFGQGDKDGERGEYQELDSCRGFCMLIRKEVISGIGNFDEVYGMGYFEEKDFCKRAVNEGYICIRAKSSYVFHKDKLSFNKLGNRDKIFSENERIYNEKWGRSIAVAFIVKKKNDLEEKKDLIHELLKEGHRVNVFSSNPDCLAYLKDHIQIRFIPTGSAFFEYMVLFKLWERLRKKRVDLIVTKDEGSLKFFNMARFIHKADVLSDNRSIIDTCKTMSKKG